VEELEAQYRAAKKASLAELAEAEKAFTAKEKRLDEREERLGQMVQAWQREARERGRRQLGLERHKLRREADRLEALRDEIASVDAETWVKKRREVLAS
jgi:hypothetical protein